MWSVSLLHALLFFNLADTCDPEHGGIDWTTATAVQRCAIHHDSRESHDAVACRLLSAFIVAQPSRRSYSFSSQLGQISDLTKSIMPSHTRQPAVNTSTLFFTVTIATPPLFLQALQNRTGISGLTGSTRPDQDLKRSGQCLQVTHLGLHLFQFGPRFSLHIATARRRTHTKI